MKNYTDIWRPVSEFEGQYMVNQNGDIYSAKKKIIRKPVLGNNGYYHVMLKSNGIRKSFMVHRIVAMAFIANPDNKKTVNHKDGNKLNNNVSNLEWCSLQDNIAHGFANGLLMPPKVKHGSEHRAAIFNDVEIEKIRALRGQGLKLREIAAIYNCHLSTIHCITKNKHYVH